MPEESNPFSHLPAELIIEGLRGFSTEQSLSLALPDGRFGSGLTYLVGPNNSGKSTCIEALAIMAQKNPPQFAIGQRNLRTDARVRIEVQGTEGAPLRLCKTVEQGGSPSTYDKPTPLPIVFISSRRSFLPFFNPGILNRQSYMQTEKFSTIRGSGDHHSFTKRLQSAAERYEEFNEVLGKVISPVPNWQLDRSNQGQMFVRLRPAKDMDHTSDGAGDGLLSLFHLIDALYDSQDGQMIVIDEPELSLHPPLQRKLSELLCEYAKTRQIVVATHSPYFISLAAITNGAELARAVKKNGEISIHQLGQESRSFIQSQIADINNPHLLGLNAREAFFLHDSIILVEGQEDIIFFRKLQKELDTQLSGTFFGWGVGGAPKMGKVARLLSDLGFSKVAGIVDKNMAHKIDELNKSFPTYSFFSLPADDIRTKHEKQARGEVKGLLDSNLKVRDEYREETEDLVRRLNIALSGQSRFKDELS